MLAVAKSIGERINEYKIVINKSTVPVGTAQKVSEQMDAELNKRNVLLEFDVVEPDVLKPFGLRYFAIGRGERLV